MRLETFLLHEVSLQIQQRSRSQHTYLFLLLTFLVLVQTSSTVFQFFQCKDFDEADPPESYLRRDYSVSCLDERYGNMKLFAMAMILV